MQVVSNISKYYIIGGELIYTDDNIVFNLNRGLKYKLSNLERILRKGQRLFLKKCNEYQLLDSDMKKRDMIFKANDLTSVDDRRYISLIENESRTTFVRFYYNQESVWEKEFPDSINISATGFNYIVLGFIFSEAQVLFLDLSTGDTLWHFSVSELGRWIDMGEEREGKIMGPIVECNGVLIMGVSGNRIIGLEKNTGKLLWNNHYPVSGSSYLVYNDEAYTCNESFCILNPHSGEENSLFPFYSVFDKHKAQAYGKRLITDKYIINVGQLDCIVMVFDKKSGEVVWRHEIYPSKKTGRRGITLKGDILDPVQYHQGKLYVLTSDKNLHVFDVEESIG